MKSCKMFCSQIKFMWSFKRIIIIIVIIIIIINITDIIIVIIFICLCKTSWLYNHIFSVGESHLYIVIYLLIDVYWCYCLISVIVWIENYEKFLNSVGELLIKVFSCGDPWTKHDGKCFWQHMKKKKTTESFLEIL